MRSRCISVVLVAAIATQSLAEQLVTLVSVGVELVSSQNASDAAPDEQAQFFPREARSTALSADSSRSLTLPSQLGAGPKSLLRGGHRLGRMPRTAIFYDPVRTLTSQHILLRV